MARSRRPPKDSIAAHFAELCRLAAGTAVILSDPKKTFKGKLIGPKEIDGKPFIGVKLSDDDKRWLPVEQSSRVTISTAKHSTDR
ncbi:MAG: hypothetical protein E6J43_04570 [Chloroflexi bacterium]|nr:MAG: hypothetical protein E6J43_04570 [Chloroflexota bacterium]